MAQLYVTALKMWPFYLETKNLSQISTKINQWTRKLKLNILNVSVFAIFLENLTQIVVDVVAAYTIYVFLGLNYRPIYCCSFLTQSGPKSCTSFLAIHAGGFRLHVIVWVWHGFVVVAVLAVPGYAGLLVQDGSPHLLISRAPLRRWLHNLEEVEIGLVTVAIFNIRNSGLHGIKLVPADNNLFLKSNRNSIGGQWKEMQ